MIAGAAVLGPLFFTPGAVLLFAVLTYSMLLIGHSVGMHRMMIHRTFFCPKWLERTLIYVGVLVGMSGPYGIVRIHDLRDWAQRRPACHDFFAHRQGYLRDITWQLGHRFEFEDPPCLRIEKNLNDDRWYRFMERTWRFHQLLIAVPLFLIGGLPWVVWGVLVRVAVSVVGHWTVTYFCHNPGPGRWKVPEACVQASNIPGLGILTYGECWHNNHHAFPESARIGLDPGQCDPAWRFIQLLALLGLASHVGLPRQEAEREDLLLAG
jgi:stearoyl-CoA desaturase (delta-9 desaturase)